MITAMGKIDDEKKAEDDYDPRLRTVFHYHVKQLYERLLSQGMKQYEIAERAGMTAPHLSQVISGVKQTTLETLERVGAAAGLTMIEVLSGLIEVAAKHPELHLLAQPKPPGPNSDAEDK